MIVLAVAFISNVRKKKGLPSTKFFAGYAFVFAVISILTDLGTPIGAGLALILMVGTLLQNGPAVFGFVDDQTGQAVGNRVGQITGSISGGGQAAGEAANPVDPGFSYVPPRTDSRNRALRATRFIYPLEPRR